MSKDAGGASFMEHLVDLITQRRERRAVVLLRWLHFWISKPRALPKPAFEPLSPVDVTDDKIAVYESELINALRTPEVRNIAITGGYGAGKSSLIKSFVRRHPEYRCAFVSLAAFEGEAPLQEQSDDEKSAAQDAIEGTIVQQLLYSVQARNVPGTRLRRITYAAKSKVVMVALGAFVAGLSYLRLMPAWPRLLPNLSSEIQWIPAVVAKLALAAGVIAGIYWIFRVLSNLRLQEVSFKGVKWDGGSSVSVLHKHVDELIHLFEMVPTDIVFVEDLDRFKDRSPFIRLREINFILNSSVGIRHPVRFVYALNDELFGRDDKSKFFDIAIPVVPIINSDNTRDMFVSLLERRVPGISSNDRVARLVETVAYHVGDLRQIKQMVNEFDLYRAVLKGGNIGDVSKELSMVAIRCIYPQEYAALLRGAGSIRYAISMFAGWQKDELAKCLEEERALIQIEARRDKEVLKDAGEIMALIWSKYEDKATSESISSISFDGGARFSKQQFMVALDKIDEISAAKRVILYRNGSFVGESTVHEVILSGSPSIRDRLALAMRPVDPDREEMDRLISRIEELRAMSLHDALNDASFMHNVSEYCKESGLHLIPFMMRNGFLGLDYADYIGYFYPGSISQDDKAALLDLRSGKLLDVGHKFTSPSLILKKLAIKELEGGVGMVSSLVCEIIRQATGEDSLRARRIEAILSASETHFDRMDEVFSSVHQSGLIRELIIETAKSRLSDLLSLAEKGNSCSQPGLRHAIATAIGSSISPSMAGTLGGRVAELLSGLSNLQEVMAAAEGSSLGGWYRIQGARMRRMSNDVDAADVQAALRLRALQVTTNNVMSVAKCLAGREIESAKYSELMRLGNDDVLSFVHSDWIGYLRETYELGADAEESEEVLIEMLREASDGAVHEFIIRKVVSKISNLDSLPKQLWPLAFDHLEIVASSDNLMRLAVLDQIDDAERIRMAGLLLGRMEVIDQLSSSLAEDATDSLCVMLAKLAVEHADAVARILIELNLFDSLFNIGDETESLLIALVKSGMPLTSSTFKAASIVSDDVAIYLAVSRFDAFLEYVTHTDPGAFIMERVMNSQLISIQERRELFSVLDFERTAVSRELADVCIETLLAVRTADEMKLLYERKRISEIFRFVEGQDAIVELLSSVLLVAPWEDMVPQISRLQSSGFTSLLEAPRRIEVESTRSNLRLLETLRIRGIVGSLNEKGGNTWARVRKSKLKIVP